MAFWVYVLRSEKDSGLYVGMTKDLDRRIDEHNRGRVASTKSRMPLKIIYSEMASDRKSARVREKYWKSGAGREKIQMLGSPAFGQVVEE